MGGLPEREYTKEEREQLHKQTCVGCVDCLRSALAAAEQRAELAEEKLAFLEHRYQELNEHSKQTRERAEEAENHNYKLLTREITDAILGRNGPFKSVAAGKVMGIIERLATAEEARDTAVTSLREEVVKGHEWDERMDGLEGVLRRLYNVAWGIARCHDKVDDEERAELVAVCIEARAALPKEEGSEEP